ncbi:hypothetical protein [Methylomonas sp. HYX-M1]|uniref:hypothetical protein n=1 Tax=Methylomonas sp. HYX-M1 TaxID=3139307 RepID=UPI00345C03C4
MPAPIVRLLRGDTWQRAWIIRYADESPVDLTGAAARLQVRGADDVVAMQASTADGRLATQPLDGRIDLVMPAAVTEIAVGNYWFDLEVTYPDGVRITYEHSPLIIIQDIARD